MVPSYFLITYHAHDMRTQFVLYNSKFDEPNETRDYFLFPIFEATTLHQLLRLKKKMTMMNN